MNGTPAALRAAMEHPGARHAVILLAMAVLLVWILALFPTMPLVGGILLISWLYIAPSRNLISASMLGLSVIYWLSLFLMVTGRWSFPLLETSSLFAALFAGMLGRLSRE